MTLAPKRPLLLATALMLGSLGGELTGRAATFTGDARVEITDTSGGLSWNNAVGAKALTVSCWFKLSIPSGTVVTDNLVIVANRTTGTWTNFQLTEPHAFAVYLSAATGNIEFSARGTGGFYTKTLIERPYLERWYHVAVVRSDAVVSGYTDGRRIFSEGIGVGDALSTNGVSVGGLGTGNYFRGDIQELQIFQSALTQTQIVANRFIDLNPAVLPALKGYYKLAFSAVAADNLKNFASAPPSGTQPAVRVGTGTIGFEETNREGEQSVFDSRKNNGQTAIASLNGTFAWRQSVFSRPSPGVPFDLSIAYNSGIAFTGQVLENGVDVYSDDAVLGPGWRHSFQTRLVPGNVFLSGSGSYIGLVTWDGSVETWQRVPGGNGAYTIEHNEYRGELHEVDGSDYVEWTTPDRLVFKFYHPTNGPEPLLKGRLVEIRDFNATPNRITLHYDTATGLLTSIDDASGGTWAFSYLPQGRLEKISGPSSDATAQWTVSFTYDPQNRLVTKSIAGPAAYTAVNLETQWQFSYSAGTSGGPPAGLLERIVDPRHKNNPSIAALRVGYDKYGRKASQADALDRVTTYQYNVPGLRQVTTTAVHGSDAAQNRSTVDTFDRKLHLIAHQTPLGFVTRSDYDDFGNVKTLTDAKGNRTTMTYDARANLLSRTNAFSEKTTWEYNAVLTGGTLLNKPTKETRPATTEAPAGWENRYAYDGGGNLSTHTDGPPGADFGTLAIHIYDARGLVTSSKDANSNETRFSYDVVTGFPASRTVAYGTPQEARWEVTPSELGWTLGEKNPLNEPKSTAYNVNGQVASITDAIGRTFTRAYDSNGNLTSESDGKGVPTTYAYDDANQRRQKTDRMVQTWDYAYTPFGELASTTAPAAVSDGVSQRVVTTRTYDADGRVTKETDPYGIAVNFEYDANGNQTATVDKLGKRWEQGFDVLNRVITATDPAGNVRHTAYDAAGRIKTTTSPRGFPTAHDYDGRGRLAKWTDAEGFSWLYLYDGAGNIRDIEDALHGHYVMTYGPRNERLTETNQDSKLWKYTYDKLARLETQTDPNGTIRTLHYDPASRVSFVEFNSGRINTLGYDNNNNVRSISRTKTGTLPTTLGLDYDALDRLILTTDTFSKTVGYTYDALGRVATKIYPGTKVLTQGYDRLGRLTSLSFAFDAGQPLNCGFAYDDAGRLTGRTYPNGIGQTNVFDAAGRLKNLDYKQGATTLIALTYAYDRNGNKTSGSEKGTLAWPASSVPAFNETARYKPDGKLIDRTDMAPATPKVFTYDYDDSGNMTHAGSSTESYTLVYDEDNRTTAITYANGTATTAIGNRYDGLGRRVARTLGTVETRYVLDLVGDMERILCDTDSSGAVKAWYVHGPDLCFKISETGAVTCYHADAMGNIIRTTNGTGATINQYAYTPYGRSLDPGNNAPDVDPYRFFGSQGVMLELPGLYIMRARYYSAEAGAFLSSDPLKHIGPGWMPNSYSYAASNPFGLGDPSGNLPQIITSILNGAKNLAAKIASTVVKAAASFVAQFTGQVTNSGGKSAATSASASEQSGAKSNVDAKPVAMSTSSVPSGGIATPGNVVAIYEQRTGTMQVLNNSGAQILERQGGYSGGNEGHDPLGVNNPVYEGVESIGPIPRGSWIMENLGKTSRGNPTIRLTPVDPAQLLGTKPGYLIHADWSDPTRAQYSASMGCIIEDQDVRKLIVEEMNLNPGPDILIVK